MKKFVGLLLCLSLSFFIVARAAKARHPPAAAARTTQKKATGQANAEALLNDSSRALAAVIKDARADSGLDPDIVKNKPFWKSTQLIAKNLKTAKTGFAAENDDFFKGIAEARRAAEQMKVDWQLTDSKNKQVIENGKKLGDAIALLRTNYSKEAARKKTGGELTAEEKADFDTIKAQQKDLLAKISKLEKSAQKDKALEKGLREIQKQAETVLTEPATVDAYIATLYLLDVQASLIRGYEFYVDKPWRADYLGLVDWFAGYYTWHDTVSYDWAWVDTSVDVYEDVTISESVSEEEISSEESYAESESFDMSEAEEDQVAAEEEADEKLIAAHNDIMEGVSDDEDEESDYNGANDVDDQDIDDDGGG